MAKPPRKSKPTAKSRATAAAPQPQKTVQLPDFFTNIRLQSLLLFGFAFLLYANTLTHGFVQDDAIVITDNMFTAKGVEGIPGILSKDTFFGFFKVEGKDALVSGGRYRPLTLVLFALLHEVAGDSPFLYHLLTVLLFAATCVLLYRTLLLLLDGWKAAAGRAPMVAWIAALLFAAHPIHTEVAANIKGCDEIVVLLGSLGALWLTVRAYDTGKMLYGILAALVFFLACLSKENAAAFVVVIPLALVVFRGASVGKSVQTSLPVWLAFLAFFILRGSILGWKFGGAPMELMNNPFLKIEGNQWVPYTFAEKLATNLYTLGKYLVLLVFPHPLTHDYYPKVIAMKTFGNPMVLLSLAAYAGMFWYAVRGLGRRDPVSFGIWFFLLTISIVSNIVFPVGTSMGERFVFMPSAGFCLVAGVLLARLSNWKTAVGVAVAVAVLFSVKTLLRNPVWASNEKLFFTDVKTSVNSAKINNACGGVLFEKAQQETDEAEQKRMFEEAFGYANQAINIYPNYKDALLTRAGCQYFLKNFDGAVADYRMAARLAEDDPKPKTYLALALREGGKYFGEQKGDLAKALQFLNESWQLNPQDAETARLLGVANGVQNNHAEALSWFKKAVELDPDNASYLFDLGTAYYLNGDPVQGEALRRRAVELNPKVLEEKQQGQ